MVNVKKRWATREFARAHFWVIPIVVSSLAELGRIFENLVEIQVVVESSHDTSSILDVHWIWNAYASHLNGEAVPEMFEIG